jgi:3-hexulose-6-phosphate synthase
VLLQVAIDRVPVERAVEIIRATAGMADIIEAGTSLIKDFGLDRSVTLIKQQFPAQILLADIKTIDEGAYEFKKAYEAGADIATVMGAASMATVAACRDTAKQFGRDYMIDLLEVSTEKLRDLTRFNDAIFCLHLPSDLAGRGLAELVAKGRKELGSVSRIAAAGGINPENLPFLKAAGVEIAIIGGSITKSADIHETVKAFKTLMDE